MRLTTMMWSALAATTTLVSTATALRTLPPALSSRDTTGSVACNASCVYSIVKKTSYASAAVGVALTSEYNLSTTFRLCKTLADGRTYIVVMEYESIDWCMGKDWCPPTIEVELDSIAVQVSAMDIFNGSDSEHCDSSCLRSKVELASRKSAIAAMLWAKGKVSGGDLPDVNTNEPPNKIEWNIRLLAPNKNFT